ncbi:MAG: four-carbon acid sugar kinase family protein [Candidatus Promineifilaceae bacterium]
MKNNRPIALSASTTLAALPAESPISRLPEIAANITGSNRTVVVLDDDPTGTQTVADIPVLTEWSIESLCVTLNQQHPAFYILTNSRSMSEAAAIRLTLEIGRNVLLASQQTGRAVAVISRSDSTLRGHYPAETDALIEVLGQHDGCLLIPYFLEGGRLTIDDVHYVLEGDTLIPAGETPFAKDGTFGYRASNLRDWVVEKSRGRISAESITSISLTTIRQGGVERVFEQLQQVADGQVVIVNAVTMCDLEIFTLGLLQAEAAGKRFIYRTAASFVPVRAGLAPRPLLTAATLGLAATGGGLIVAGSYVPKTTQQIEALLAQTEIVSVVVQVAVLLDDEARSAEIARVVTATDAALGANQDVIVYTSRALVTDHMGRSGLEIGRIISDSLVQIVQSLTQTPRYLVAKGGITSSDIATDALKLRRASIAGQILPGVPVWQCDAESLFPTLPYVIFPGNVGNSDALAQLVQQLATPSY